MRLPESAIIDQLARGPSVVSALCGGLADGHWRWSPAPGRWSAHEVICHLYDEERDDFRARLRSTLDDPSAAWNPIDPEGWVGAHDYASCQSESVLADFVTERKGSVTWLRSLSDPPWSNAYMHKSGPVTAGDLLVSWAAHDLQHIRQLTRLGLAYLAHHAPHSPDYAT